MSRTAEELMTHHIESMMKMKENSNLDEALADYSEDLVAITRLDGRTRTMGYDTLTDTMRNTFTFATKLGMDVESAVEKLDILFRQSEGGYITLLASLKPFSSFASFTYMIENDKAIYVTGYAKTALSMPSLGVKAHPFPENPETLATVEKHLSNLRKHDAHALPQDYADDAIILTNLSERPYHGTAAIEYYCSNLLEKASVEIDALTDPDTKIIVKEAVAEIACIGFQNRAKKESGVMTYRVQQGKIVFESAIFQNG